MLDNMLEFLTTLPGILIICGVILLILAIILLITGNKKDKQQQTSTEQNKEENNDVIQNVQLAQAEEVKVVQEPVVEQVIEQPVIEPVAPVEPVTVEEVKVTQEPVVEKVDVQPVIEQPIEEVKIAEQPVIEPVVEQPVSAFDIPAFVEQPKVEEPKVEQPQMTFVAPTVNPQVTVNEEVKNDEFILPFSVGEEEKVEQPEPQIYGGATPTYSFEQPAQPAAIYGGNDPLEKTQTLPIVEENHVPYGGNVSPVQESNNTNGFTMPTPSYNEDQVDEPTITFPKIEQL